MKAPRQRTASLTSLLAASCCLVVLVASAVVSQSHHEQRRGSLFAARRAADDSRPLTRVHLSAAQARSDDGPESLVVGKFKAPAPSRISRQRVPKSSDFGSQVMSASFRVAESSPPERLLHGIVGASLSGSQRQQSQRSAGNQKQSSSVLQTVGAKMQVSDEGLNYPPSKLSADIHGNVAEIVTAPPEAVENEALFNF